MVYPIRYIPKEISWLSFNERVLQEADDSENPLMERIKFLGIFSNNLDEFFRVRVATLKRFSAYGKKATKMLGYNPLEVLHVIQEKSLQLNYQFSEIFQKILNELAINDIIILNETQLEDIEKRIVMNYFHAKVRPKLFPVMLDQVAEFPDLKDHSIYQLVTLSHTDLKHKTKYALIEIPTAVLPRFFILPENDNKHRLILLDDVVRLGLAEIFSIFDYNQFQAYTVKLTRDAELDIDDDINQSYINQMADSLKQRKEGNPVRFVHDAEMPEYLLEVIRNKLQLRPGDVTIPGGRYHNFRDFIEFPDFRLGRLRFEALAPVEHKLIQHNSSIFKSISKSDILFHFPYHSFDYVIDTLREASIDPKVESIKITLYRVAKNSSVVNALINAVKNGKSVTVILELQARFDEEANIYWANRMQEEGIKLVFGVPGLKVHSKLVYITRREKNNLHEYAIIGTGNFNESTARIYSDHSLFTKDHRLTSEVAKVFEFFDRNYKVTTFRNLIVSPFFTRRRFIRMIDNEIKNASEGKPAYMIWKLNNLVDEEIIEKLYEASQKGVKITLIVRGMFSLIPGKKGLSQNITAFSIVDRFLEHSRIYLFANGGRERLFISSADMMARNIDRRVEVTCPIYNKDIQNELRQFLSIQMNDNVRARYLDLDRLNNIRLTESPKPIRSQWAAYEFIKKQNS